MNSQFHFIAVKDVQEAGAMSPYRTLPTGSKIIPLCSLTAIPLFLESIDEVHDEQVSVRGQAVVFPSYKVRGILFFLV
jgi:hypothetical protein